MTAWVGLIGVAVILGALSYASAVFAPVIFALFLIALSWPMQRWLQRRLPRLIALLISILVLFVTFFGFASIIVWGFSRVGRWAVANMGLFQALYDQLTAGLEAHGIAVAGLWAEHFNVGLLFGVMQRVTGQLNTTLSFWVVVLVYVILGLLEVDKAGDRVRSLSNRSAIRMLIEGGAETAAKVRRYMAVRTLMSVLTGLLFWIFASLFDLPLAREWGVIAFALNYIPIIGPFTATLFPTVLAMVKFGSWEAMAVVFASLNGIQFLSGSYIEPRVSGTALAMSPFVVLFSIFLWTYLWGLSGTFLGVPIAFTILTLCAYHPSTRWLTILFGSQAVKSHPSPIAADLRDDPARRS
ncbi:putative PurR-regulated permease PerM [Skermanella aerolata]|uniref:AI-2E family transporter n=1 Tax=Skermanella aerolata TaxID=393310 RepID=UPI003D1A5F09